MPMILLEGALPPKEIPNDGRQTPMKGHPVFIGQHATATCCRSCLYKWYHIDKDKSLSEDEINYIIKIIMTWINRELVANKKRGALRLIKIRTDGPKYTNS